MTKNKVHSTKEAFSTVRALKLALEALEDLGMKHFESTGEVLYKETFTAIKEALMSVPDGAQPEQEPVAWMSPHIKDRDGDWVYDFSMYRDDYYMFPVYKAPLQRTWVGLTQEELSEIYNRTEWDTVNGWEYERAIEAKLKEKNT